MSTKTCGHYHLLAAEAESCRQQLQTADEHHAYMVEFVHLKTASYFHVKVKDAARRVWVDGGRRPEGLTPTADGRPQLVISKSDYAQIPARGSRSRRIATVTDLLTGKVYRLRRASCGLPRCLCALAFAPERKKTVSNG